MAGCAAVSWWAGATRLGDGGGAGLAVKGAYGVAMRWALPTLDSEPCPTRWLAIGWPRQEWCPASTPAPIPAPQEPATTNTAHKHPNKPRAASMISKTVT